MFFVFKIFSAFRFFKGRNIFKLQKTKLCSKKMLHIIEKCVIFKFKSDFIAKNIVEIDIFLDIFLKNKFDFQKETPVPDLALS